MSVEIMPVKAVRGSVSARSVASTQKSRSCFLVIQDGEIKMFNARNRIEDLLAGFFRFGEKSGVSCENR